MLSLVPLATLLLSIPQGLERFHLPGLAGGIVAMGGIAVIFHEQIGTDVPVLSLLALIAAAFCAAQGNIFLKRYPPDSLISANVVAMSLGAVSLLVLSVLSGEPRVVPVRWETWAALAYLSTLGTLGAFLLLMFVLRHWSASAVSYQFVLAPMVAIVLAAMLLDETVTSAFFLGGGLVVFGVYLGALLPSRRRTMIPNQ